jgi:hypothetical protein
MKTNDINKLGTELSLGPNQIKRSNAAQLQGLTNKSKMQEHQKKQESKDFFIKYFKQMQYVFDLKQIDVNMAMDKVKEYLEAKEVFSKQNEQNGKQKKSFTGKKLAYGATILYLVSKERNLKLEMNDIVEASTEKGDELDTHSVKNAKKQLEKKFKNWFRQGNSPESLLPVCTE